MGFQRVGHDLFISTFTFSLLYSPTLTSVHDYWKNPQLWLHGALSAKWCLFFNTLSRFETTLLAQTVKCLPAMRETQVQSLGQEDPREKGMAPHSSTLAWRILWTEEPGGLQSLSSQRVRHDRATNTRFVMAFLPWSKRLSILWLQSPFAAILALKKIMSVSTFFPSFCHGRDRRPRS